jgi:cysteinyl-tRNA synthetase
MDIKIFNSLKKKKEIFKPLIEGRVSMYVCGVTVYDQCHIGHARSAFVFDVIRKYFKFSGYDVLFVRNVTDIDDKIIDAARREKGDLKQNTQQVASKYFDLFKRDMMLLGIDDPDIEPRATDNIDEIIKVTASLVKKGFAYVSDGSVYFNVRKFKKYGKLSKQSIAKMRSGVRVGIEKDKKDTLDFALWKRSKENEPFWESPWGKGRPGWHIECSCMSMKYLGQNFDIHCGGRDLIFPHHENEIAQSEAYSNKKFANYWIHNGLLTIEGQKMSKSLGNFISITEFLKKYHPEALKIFFLGTHYASPIDFSYQKMDEAKSARDRFYILFDKIDRLTKSETAGGKRTKSSGLDIAQIEKIREKFKKAMDDDFNTAKALSVLFDLVNMANKHIAGMDRPTSDDALVLRYAKDTITELGRVLGLFKEKAAKETSGKERELVEYLIKLRREARDRKDFAAADKIRLDLKNIGVILEDSKEGTTWRKS